MSILTVTDAEKGSESVISAGHELANGLEKKQIILHVISSTGDEEQAQNNVETIVQDVLGKTELTTIKITKEKSERDSPAGRVADRIADEAEKINADYVVVGSKKRSPIGKAMLGSVAQKVLINSSAPVVVVEQTG